MKRVSDKILLLVFLSMFLLNFDYIVKANSDEISIIEDTYDYFTAEEREAIESEVTKLPEIYKIVVLPTVNGTIEKTSKALFEYKKLSQDTILILVLTNDKKIYAITGDALKKKGLDEKFFKLEIDTYFVPNVTNEAISQALIELAEGISKDIPKYLVKEKNSPKIPNPPDDTVLVGEDQKSWKSSQLVYGAGILLVIILGFVISKKNTIKK